MLWDDPGGYNYGQFLRERKAELFAAGKHRDWWSLYQQEPTAADGDQFKAEWFRRYTARPADADLSVYMSGDFAVTKDAGDFSSLIVWGVDHVGQVYVLDAWHGRVASDALIMHMVRLFKQWKPKRFIGESGPIRRAVEPFLTRVMQDTGVFCVLEWLPSVNDKVTNSVPFQALMSNGRVLWPATDWAEAIKAELLKFPGAKHDDRVDACSLFGRYFGDIWKALPPKPAQPEIDWNAPLRMDQIFKTGRASRMSAGVR
jgi:predicted phage terminase large subunit-like protein